MNITIKDELNEICSLFKNKNFSIQDLKEARFEIAKSLKLLKTDILNKQILNNLVTDLVAFESVLKNNRGKEINGKKFLPLPEIRDFCKNGGDLRLSKVINNLASFINSKE